MSQKIKGYASKFLRLDLTDASLRDWSLDEPTYRAYLGGTGVGSKILYDEVPPEVDWSDPLNRVTIASGPLGGTSVGGSGTISLVTKGALTGGATSVQANGLFGAYMRLSGYDGFNQGLLIKANNSRIISNTFTDTYTAVQLVNSQNHSIINNLS